MLDFGRSTTNEVFVVPTIFHIRNNDTFACGHMHKLVVVQINANMIDVSATKWKENKISFFQFIFIFAFYVVSHITRAAGKIFPVDLLIEYPHKTGTIDARFLCAAQTVRASHPIVYKLVERLIIQLPNRNAKDICIILHFRSGQRFVSGVTGICWDFISKSAGFCPWPNSRRSFPTSATGSEKNDNKNQIQELKYVTMHFRSHKQM